jgi:hypothetical protein
MGYIGSFSSSRRTASPPRFVPIVITCGQNTATCMVRLIWALAAARGTGREWLLADRVQSLGQLDSERHTDGDAMNDDQGRLLILDAIQTWDPCKRPHGAMQIAPIIRCRDIPITQPTSKLLVGI